MTERRGDFLASVCLIDEGGALDPALAQLIEVARTLERRFVYFELVYVVGQARKAELEAAANRLAALRNLRVIVTDNGFYRSRYVAAREAIGDVVAVTDLVGLTPAMLLERMAEAYEVGAVMIGTRPDTGLSPVRGALSLISRHRVNGSDSRTMILPRDHLNALLMRPTSVLDMRFEPRLGPPRYKRFPLTPAHRRRLAFRTKVQQTYELLTLIVMSGAPRYLKGFAALGMFTAAAAGLYGVYAVLIVLFAPTVERGWFSTSVVQAGSIGFVAVGMSITCLAIAAIYERLAGTGDDDVVAEINNINFFEKSNQRIVELEPSERLGSAAPENEAAPNGNEEKFTRAR